MNDDLEEFTPWQRMTEARLATLERAHFVKQESMLQALHLTQNEHTAKLGNIDNRLTSVEGVLQKLNVGVQTIVGLLSPAVEEEKSGSEPPN